MNVRSSPTRALSLVLAVSWALMPAFTALHAAEHVHRYCPEHHALEESAPQQVRAAATADGVAQLTAAQDDERLQHVACALAHVGSRPSTAVASAVRTVPPDPQSGPTALARPFAHAALAPLSVAPKSSPPSAA